VAAGTYSSVAHWISANTKVDGTGTYLPGASVSAVIIGVTPSSITVKFTNNYGKTIYIVNNSPSGIPFMMLLGYPVSQAAGYSTQRDESSIKQRGDRTVSSEIDGIQVREEAELIGTTILSICAQPRGLVGIHVMGDPRRFPGQFVRLSDVQGTEVSGLWMITAISHNRSGAEFTQDLMLVQIYEELVWDVGAWDQTSWSE
jgi:hypothetical protein